MQKNEPIPELHIDHVLLDQAAKVLRAVNHPLRQKMLHLLHRSKGTHVTNVFTTLDLEQSVASQHLAHLRKAKIVHTERNGREIHYRVHYERLHQLHLHSKSLTDGQIK